MQVPVSKAETEAHTLKFNLMKALLLCKIRFLCKQNYLLFPSSLVQKSNSFIKKYQRYKTIILMNNV